MIFDCFPFFNELDILEIRLHEMDPIVDRFVIVESGETYGGHRKPYTLADNWDRFVAFHRKIIRVTLPHLRPFCTDRTSGRLREAYQRDMILPVLRQNCNPWDVIIFSDCDEIPNRQAVEDTLPLLDYGIYRLKQHSYYYNVHTLVDYGHDFASRARMGKVEHLQECGSLYNFRMFQKDFCPGIENAGWHFSYFGGPERIKTKVAALSPFLSEYRLFGDGQLSKDIEARKDLHHRRCEMPETFTHVENPVLPAYLQANRERFPHFFKKAARV